MNEKPAAEENEKPAHESPIHSAFRFLFQHVRTQNPELKAEADEHEKAIAEEFNGPATPPAEPGNDQGKKT